MVKSFLAGLLLVVLASVEARPPQIVETLYGTEIVEEPIILDLLASPAMQRLKRIDQSGIPHYIGKIGPYSRFIHSFGVYALLKRFNAPLKEQVAGLLHDASHTVFSHTGDWLYFQGNHEHSYQDNIHAWYLEQQHIDLILQQHGMTLEQALPKGNGYDLLEQNLPDVCADRLEYNLFTGHLWGLFSQNDVDEILRDIQYVDGRWFFGDPAVAAKFARVSVFFTENLWGANWNAVVNELSAKALKRALLLNIINIDDIHFGIDVEVLSRLRQTNDAEINQLLSDCFHVETRFVECLPEEADYSCTCKFRGINPWVYVGGQYVRLTELDKNFAEYYMRVQKKISKGIHVKFLNINARESVR